MIDPESGVILGESGAEGLTGNEGTVTLNLNQPAQPWDEFNPKRYRLEWSWLAGEREIQSDHLAHDGGAIEPEPPHHLTLDLGERRTLDGLRILPRQDSANGRPRTIATYQSDDGQTWSAPMVVTQLDGSAKKHEARFPSAITTRFLKLELRDEINGQKFSSLAEVELLAR